MPKPITEPAQRGEMSDTWRNSSRAMMFEMCTSTVFSPQEATAPIVVANFGDSDAAKAKLNILMVMDEIEVRGKPSDLPQQIEVDGSKYILPLNTAISA